MLSFKAMLAMVIGLFALQTAGAKDRVVVIPLGSESPAPQPQPFATFARGSAQSTVTADDEVLARVTLTASSDGVVLSNASVRAAQSSAGDNVRCSISLASNHDFDFLSGWESGGIADGAEGSISVTRGDNVSLGDSLTLNLICDHFGTNEGSATILSPTITAAFYPNPS